MHNFLVIEVILLVVLSILFEMIARKIHLGRIRVRDIIHSIVLAMVIGIVCDIYVFYRTGVTVETYEFADMIYNLTADYNNLIDVNEYLSIESGVTDETADLAVSLFEKILYTEEAKDKFINDGWQIVLCNEYPQNGQDSGATYYSLKLIEIQKDNVEYAMQHELMHYMCCKYKSYVTANRGFFGIIIDGILQENSVELAIKELYESESSTFDSGVSQFMTDYGKTEDAEFIAVVFDSRNNKECQNTAPNTIDFVNNIYNSILKGEY